MKIAKVISTIIKQVSGGNWTLVKTQVSGRDDIQETPQAVPFGIDARPIEGIKAVYSATENTGEPILIGYFMEVAEVEAGEIKTFSTNDSGAIQAFILHKKNGDLHLNGDADNAVRFSELKTAFDELKADFNNHLTNWNTFAAAYVPGTGGAPADATSSTSSTANIDPAKIDEIKTP